MKWWEVRLTVPKESTDAIASLLHEYSDIQGVAMEGAVVDSPLHPEYGESFVQDLEDMGTDITVIVYVPDSISIGSIRERIFQVLERVQQVGLNIGNGKKNTVISLVDESSWEGAWKEHLHPIPIGNSFLVIPTWEQNVPREYESRRKIIIEPGMAFGTGTHETTQMCLEAIEMVSMNGKRVLDVGCGTAVLSIAAALMNAKEVNAVDIDPVAIHVALQNVIQNNLSHVVFPEEGNLLQGFVKDKVFDVIFANILRDVVIALTPDAVNRLAPGGIFISSGYILHQQEMVHQALISSGLEIFKVYQKGDWVCTVAVKPS